MSGHLPRHLLWVLAGLTLVWGFNWTAMKVALAEIAPLSFRGICLAAASGLLFGYLRLTRQQVAIPRSQWPRLVLISLFNITFWNLLVTYGLRLVPAGRAAILAYTMPAWAIPLSIIVLGERLDGRKLFGFALGMGAMILLLRDEFGRLSGAPLGATLVLGGALSWALATVLQKKYPVSAPLPAMTAWMMLIGGVPIYLGALVFDLRQAIEAGRISVGLWPALATLYNIVFAFAWAQWACLRLVTSVSVTVFSLSMLVVPLVGVLSGMLFLGERPGWPEYGALLLVFGSLLSVALPRRVSG